MPRSTSIGPPNHLPIDERHRPLTGTDIVPSPTTEPLHRARTSLIVPRLELAWPPSTRRARGGPPCRPHHVRGHAHTDNPSHHRRAHIRRPFRVCLQNALPVEIQRGLTRLSGHRISNPRQEHEAGE